MLITELLAERIMPIGYCNNIEITQDFLSNKKSTSKLLFLLIFIYFYF